MKNRKLYNPPLFAVYGVYV